MVSSQSEGLASVKISCWAAVEKFPSSQKSPNSSKKIKEDVGEEEEAGTKGRSLSAGTDLE